MNETQPSVNCLFAYTHFQREVIHLKIFLIYTQVTYFQGDEILTGKAGVDCLDSRRPLVLYAMFYINDAHMMTLISLFYLCKIIHTKDYQFLFTFKNSDI